MAAENDRQRPAAPGDIEVLTDRHVDNAVEVRAQQFHEEAEALGPREEELAPGRRRAGEGGREASR